MAKMPKKPKHVSAFVDRHGKQRFRWRAKGRSAYLPGHYDSPESKALIAQFEAGIVPQLAERATPGTIGDLVPRFYRSGTFMRAGETRRARARGIIEPFRVKFAEIPVAEFRFDDIEQILQSKAAKRREGKRMVGGLVAAE